MAAEGGYQPTSDDRSLERGIKVAADAVAKAGTIDAQIDANRLLVSLANRRSPEMVEYVRRRGGNAGS